MSGGPTEPETAQGAEAVGGAFGLAIGTRIGRFTVLEPLGAGGMGVVVAAHDPQLDRRVALKLVRGERLRAQGRERLLREGQAMARLAHPNVGTVHEVGEIGEDVFLVMELVEGETLRDWLRARPRSWREVLDVFVAAGRGLFAAHKAGLVHRDFKPGNVLVDRDGRARVLDFGIAASEGRRSEGVIGTPKYMAPEQLLVEEVDGRADQYAFCVSLDEALDGAGPRALRRAVARGRAPAARDRYPSMVETLAALEAVPLRRRRIGLAGAGLVAALGVTALVLGTRPSPVRPCGDSARHLDGVWDHATRSKVLAAIAASKLPYAAGTAATVAATLDRYTGRWVAAHVEICEATAVHHEQSPQALDLGMACLDRRLGEVQALVRLLVAPDADVIEHAVTAAAGLSPPSVCDDAERLAGRTPLPADADPDRVAAVERDLADARALIAAGRYLAALEKSEAALGVARTSAFRTLEAEAMFRTGEARGELQRKDASGALFDAAVAAQRAGDNALLADAWTRLAAADAAIAVDLAGAEDRLALADAAVTHLGDDHRRDVLLTVRAILREQQGRPTDALADRQAALKLHAGHAGDDPTTANLHTGLGAVLEALGRYDEALGALDRARSIAETALGGAHPQVAAILDVRASVLYHTGKLADALATRRRALALLEAALPADSPAVLKMRSHIAVDLYHLGDYDGCVALEKELVGRYREARGADHPDTATALVNHASTLLAIGRYSEAMPFLEEGLAIRERAFGPDHPQVAHALFWLANGHWYLHRAADGIAPMRRALAIMLRVYGPDHPDTLAYRGNLGSMLSSSGHFDEARVEMEAALAGKQRTLGPAHEEFGYALTTLGDLWSERDVQKSHDYYARAADVLEKVLGSGHMNYAAVLVGVGVASMQLGHHDDARQKLQHAIRILDQPGVDRSIGANARFRLAMVEWATGHASLAREHARGALAAYGTASDYERERAEVRAWMKKRSEAADPPKPR